MKAFSKAGTASLTIVLLCTALFLCGCWGKNYKAKVTGVEFAEVTTKKLKLIFTITVNNPGNSPVAVKKLAYKFSAFNADVQSEDLEKSIRIPEKGTSQFDLKISVPYEKLASAGIDAIGNGRLEYGLEVTITLATPKGDVALPITKSGSIKSRNLRDVYGQTKQRPIDLGEGIVTVPINSIH
jgi:LEA14-like dessication related protein